MRVLFLFPVLFVLIFSACKTEPAPLPILGFRDTEETIVDGEPQVDTLYHTVSDFKFINQDSIWITPETFKDKVYIADFFFTSCPTICPITKRESLRLYEEYKDRDEVFLISHSVDTKYDSVPVLKEYANKLDISSDKWHLVTGKKEDIYGISKDYLVSAMEDASAPGGYIHDGRFLLVDKKRQIRGFYDGTDSKSVDQLMIDVERLLNEEE